MNGSLRIEGNFYAAGSKAGYVVDIMQNIDNAALSPGDVVVIVGSSAPVLGQIPVVTVKKATSPYDTGVAGVVDQEQGTMHALSNDTRTAHGGYVTVVTLGSFKQVKVDASFGPIHAGDLLTTSSHAGYAMKVTDKCSPSAQSLARR